MSVFLFFEDKCVINSFASLIWKCWEKLGCWIIYVYILFVWSPFHLRYNLSLKNFHNTQMEWKIYLSVSGHMFKWENILYMVIFNTYRAWCIAEDFFPKYFMFFVIRIVSILLGYMQNFWDLNYHYSLVWFILFST